MQGYVAKLVETEILQNIKEALEISRWKEVVTEEKRSIEKNEIWEIIELSRGKKHVGCKWVFTIKYNANAVSALQGSASSKRVYTN